jgi:hypothetical protein
MNKTAPFPDIENLSEYEADYLFDLLGYRILRGALSPAQLRAINKWIDIQPPRRPGEWFGNVVVHSYQGHDGTNYQNIIEGGPVFEKLIDNPVWIDSVRRYVHGGLSLNEAFLNVRKQAGFIGIHSGGHLPSPIAQTRHHTGNWMVGQINILMALTDIGPGDGATVIVPGSHKCDVIHPAMTGGTQQTYRDDLPAGEALMTQEVYLKAGDALFFTDGLTHGSATRVNPGERRILIYRYSPHHFIPRYHYLPSDELLARLTPARRQIVQPIPPRLAPGRAVTGPQPASR